MAVFRSLLNPVDSCSDIRRLMKRRFSKAFLPPINDFPEIYMARVYKVCNNTLKLFKNRASKRAVALKQSWNLKRKKMSVFVVTCLGQ